MATAAASEANGLSHDFGKLATTHEESPPVARKTRYNKEDSISAEQVFRIEDGSETSQAVDRAALMGNILLENPEIETRWYFKFFLGQTHKNFVVFLSGTEVCRSGGSAHAPLYYCKKNTPLINLLSMYFVDRFQKQRYSRC